MTIINKYAKEKNDKDGILALSALASKSKAKDPQVINATVGMMIDEEGNFVEYKKVNEITSKFTATDKYAYSESSGGSNYARNVEKLIFGPFLGQICEDFKLSTVATPGGSGAIALSLQNYLEEGDTVLLPSSMWEPYIQFAKERKLKYRLYNLYRNHLLDVASIKTEIEKVESDKVFIIINDPCHNPTGFSMTDQDYDHLIEMFNSLNKKVVILFDISYIDYADGMGQKTRKNYLKLKNLNSNILVLFAFSGSKTFGLYGLRIGACTIISKNEEEIALFKQAADYTARATWSSPSKYGLSVINQIVGNEDNYTAFYQELAYYTNLLKIRANNFIASATKLNLSLSEYKNGFFIKVYTDNPATLAKVLIKNKVFVVPLKDSIRIALSAISAREAELLPAIIDQTMKEI